MYRMKNIVEILLGLLLIFLVIGQPRRLRHFTHTTIGKIIFLAITIGSSFYSLSAGVLIALIYIILRKDFMLTEGMENNTSKVTEKTDFVKKYCKEGNVDQTMNPPTLKYKNEKCNPCDDDCDFEITSAKEQLTVDEALRPQESNSIPV
jgi:hypothetical protein